MKVGIWNLEASNTPLERSWKYLSNGILHAHKCSNITFEKEKRKKCSRLVIVNQGGQNNRNGKSSNTNYHIIEL